MKRRGVSPAIAVIIMMAVAVVGALTAGTAMQAQTRVSSTVTKAEIIDAVLSDIPTPGKSYFSAVVRNTGTTTINYISVGFIDSAGSLRGATVTDAALQPGRQWQTYFIPPVDVDGGKRYTIYLEVSTDTMSSGSTFRATGSIVAGS
jgi:flagellin-like protein